MHSKIALVFVFVIAMGLVGSASAHKSEVVGDYKIEVGWKNEPPVVGMVMMKWNLCLITTWAMPYQLEFSKDSQQM
ncbi:MAG: hypothetical protein K8Q89_03940 [Nitrosarchaeum sp.]|nr:hypothetical protein [Nitrosarchaeum sp.]